MNGMERMKLVRLQHLVFISFSLIADPIEILKRFYWSNKIENM